MKTYTTLVALLPWAIMAIVMGYPVPAFATVQEEHNIRRQQWQLLHADDYVFRFERSCYCLPEVTTPGLIHVVDGEIVSVRHPVTNEALDPIFYLTVDDLFDQVQFAIDFPADALLIEYDDAFCYPTRIDIDFISMAIDDEMSFSASDLRMIPEPASITLMIVGLVVWKSWLARAGGQR